MDAALIIACVSLTTSAIFILERLYKLYDKHQNPYKYAVKKIEDKTLNFEGTKIEAKQVVEKMNLKQAKLLFKLDKAQGFPSGIYAKPNKKNYKK